MADAADLSPAIARCAGSNPAGGTMNRNDFAWRGFVDHDGKVIAWPTMIIDHREFHRVFYTDDSDFLARWRQWSPGEEPDFDPGTPPEAKQIVKDWLNG
jgi:hypothetical protein